MSHYASYVSERLGKLVYEFPEGFIVYWYPEHKEHGETLYIEDIFVDAKHRRTGIATQRADEICEAAKGRGVKVMYGSVNPLAKGATNSLKCLLYYGMDLSHIGDDGLIYFIKSLED